jgi:hypothetical protein
MDMPSDRIPPASVPIITAPVKPDSTQALAAPIHSVHASPVSVNPAPMLPKPGPVPSTLANTSLTVPIGLPVVHGLQDFSALRSGSKDPWRSLGHRNHRSYPQRPHRTHLAPDPHRHSNSNPRHPYHSISPPQYLFNPHSHSYPPRTELPANIFQIIRHPIRIYETKLKITKTLSIVS